MKLSWTETTVGTLNLVVTVIALIVTTLLALYLNALEPTAAKSLTAEFLGPSDPLKDLADSSVNIQVDLRSEGRVVPRIYIYRASLKNTGVVPILASDFHGNIRMLAQAPWSILAIGPERAKPRPQEITLAWQKKSESEFTTSPTLINPGDSIDVSVYLTAPPEEAARQVYNSPSPLSWDMRVANLASITLAPNLVDKLIDEQGPISVHLWGWGIPFIIVIFALLMWLHLSIIRTLPIKRPLVGVALGVVAGVLSLCGAEALTTYTFGIVPGINIVEHWANAPPLILNICFIAALFATSRALSASPSSET